MKTLQEIKRDVHAAITGDTFTELMAKGYKINYTWVKTSEIGAIIKVKRKNIYRVQITEPDLCGHYYKAYVAEIPAG